MSELNVAMLLEAERQLEAATDGRLLAVHVHPKDLPLLMHYLDRHAPFKEDESLHRIAIGLVGVPFMKDESCGRGFATIKRKNRPDEKIGFVISVICSVCGANNLMPCFHLLSLQYENPMVDVLKRD